MSAFGCLFLDITLLIARWRNTSEQERMLSGFLADATECIYRYVYNIYTDLSDNCTNCPKTGTFTLQQAGDNVSEKLLITRDRGSCTQQSAISGLPRETDNGCFDTANAIKLCLRVHGGQFSESPIYPTTLESGIRTRHTRATLT